MAAETLESSLPLGENRIICSLDIELFNCHHNFCIVSGHRYYFGLLFHPTYKLFCTPVPVACLPYCNLKSVCRRFAALSPGLLHFCFHHFCSPVVPVSSCPVDSCGPFILAVHRSFYPLEDQPCACPCLYLPLMPWTPPAAPEPLSRRRPDQHLNHPRVIVIPVLIGVYTVVTIDGWCCPDWSWISRLIIFTFKI